MSIGLRKWAHEFWLMLSGIIRNALAVAKADYHGKVRKSLVHVFVFGIKRLVDETPALKWYK